MLRAAFIGFMASGLIGSFIAVESIAVFAHSRDNEANTFATGTVAISNDPAAAFITFANMAPGDSVTSPLLVENTGSLEFRYAMTTAATNDDSKGLAGQLVLTIFEPAGDCSTPGAALYGPGALSGGAFGSSNQGADAGDRVLAAAGTETLCFTVELPLATGDAYQDAATTATFTFSAEQTANNP